MKPDPAVISVLREALRAAERGEAEAVLVMLKHPDGEWDCDYLVVDTDDLCVELRTRRIQIGQEHLQRSPVPAG